MTAEEVKNIVLETVEEMRPYFVPNPRTRDRTSTGNMALHSLSYDVQYIGKEIHIKIYMDEGIAPYVVYTNEPWLSPYWRGKQNPNEGWWERVVAELNARVSKKVQGNMNLAAGLKKARGVK